MIPSGMSWMRLGKKLNKLLHTGLSAAPVNVLILRNTFGVKKCAGIAPKSVKSHPA